MCELRREKNNIRFELIERRRNILPEKREAWDKKIADVLLGSISYRFCDIMLIYVSTKIETSTSYIIKRAFENKKIIACPISNIEDRSLSFKVINSADELSPGSYNIPEPPKANRSFNDDAISGAFKRPPLIICVVPCLSYDSYGYRIGYGKGYYDRFLSSFEGTKIGLCYSEFKVNSLPKGKYDVKLDVIITEKGVTVIK